MSAFENFKYIQPTSALNLVSLLANLSQTHRGETKSLTKLPLVRIEFSLGQSYEGYVWGFDSSIKDKNLLFLRIDEGRSAGTNVEIKNICYLDLNQSFQISFIQPEAVLDFLNFEKKSGWTDLNASQDISSLHLKRLLVSLQDEFRKSYGLELNYSSEAISTDSKENLLLRDLVFGLKEYLKKTAADDLGKQALKKISGFSIVVKPGAFLHVFKTGQTIEIEFDTKLALSQKETFFSVLDELF